MSPAEKRLANLKELLKGEEKDTPFAQDLKICIKQVKADMPTFIVMLDSQALKTIPGSILWVSDARLANSYSSKYQAKRHLKQLDNVPDDVKIVELLTVED